MTDADDPGLHAPLHGVRLVEASAGTGKTFALATLYVRAVVEAGLPVDALLAVTFTEAATAELRLRIRERLRLAQRFADGETHASGAEAITRAIVARALAAAGGHEAARTALRMRLRAAVEAMDLAPVLTIHGFCRRALAEHALEAGLPPGDRELVANDRALRQEVATGLWRDVCRDAADARTLVSVWSSPAALADGLVRLWSVQTLLPPPADDAPAEQAARDAVARAVAAICDACDVLGEDTCAQLRAALATGGINASTHKETRVEKIVAALLAWVAARGDGDAPDALDVLGTRRLAKSVKKDFVARVSMPRNALTDAIDAWKDAMDALAGAAANRRIALLHRLRSDGRQRLVALKRQRRLQGFDDLIRDVADALAGPHGDALARRLRDQYRFAFVDEFQDTDAQQWAIFRRVFADAPMDGGPRALFLIGDPKQAIYRFRGGDVHTYLEAAGRADDYHRLGTNFRSRPRLLEAVQALYAGGGERPFGAAGVEFVAVAPGGQVADDALRIDGAVAPALELMTWDDAPGGKPMSADAARERAATGTVARIRDLLQPGRTVLRDRLGERALAPGDIAVLVPSHRDAKLVQRRLARAGVPCVAAGRDSLYATDEAADLLTLLQACLHLADDMRLRAALATPLLGLAASAIAALDGDDVAHRRWQDRALAWRQRWERHGPLALVADLCAAAAPRLLALDDGERRLANWMQLAEALQSETAGRDPAAVAAHLSERIAASDEHGEEDLLRLESDAERVHILTLHASKGLEFPLVFLPFLSHGGPAGGKAPLAVVHRDGEGRVGLLKGADDDAWKAAGAQETAELAEERLRVLYVGLTRARLATFAGFGPTRDAHKAAFASLLTGEPAPSKEALTPAAIAARLAALAASAPAAITVTRAATALPPGSAALPPAPTLPAAAVPRRVLSRDWGMHSFSALAREAGGAEARRAGDEPEPLLPPDRFAGARFGNVLHEALENVDFAAWRDWRDDAPPPGQDEPLRKALRGGGYGGAADLADGVPRLAALVRDTLNARMPEGVRLADLPPAARIAELEFHFDLAPAEVSVLLAQLHGHGLVAAREGFGARQRLEGLLTGFVDLVYEHEGRVYVLDYKSNLLPAYDAAALADAIAHGEYDLQYLLYTLAVHRWLRFRKPDYDYDRDVGGVRYLFCRGLGAGGGVYATKPPRALVESLDALLRRAEAPA